MNIYITRHGQTDYNKERKVCGRSDISLNENGLNQAQLLKQNIINKKLSFNDIYVSPLIRARQTVAPIEKHFNQKAIIDNRLMEFNFGDKEACDFDDPDFRKQRNDPFQYFKNGESMVKVAARVYNFLDELIKKYDNNSTILIVSHGTTSKIINTYFNSQSLEEFNNFKIDNCQLLEYKINK
jgi:probable phosphoglycerate mutase